MDTIQVDPVDPRIFTVEDADGSWRLRAPSAKEGERWVRMLQQWHQFADEGLRAGSPDPSQNGLRNGQGEGEGEGQSSMAGGMADPASATEARRGSVMTQAVQDEKRLSKAHRLLGTAEEIEQAFAKKVSREV